MQYTSVSAIVNAMPGPIDVLGEAWYDGNVSLEYHTTRQEDKETRRQGDKETGRQGDKETGRQGDRATERQGDKEI